MIGHGVSSRSSHSWAAGRTTPSAKPWTQSLMSFWSWVSSSVKVGSAGSCCSPWGFSAVVAMTAMLPGSRNVHVQLLPARRPPAPRPLARTWRTALVSAAVQASRGGASMSSRVPVRVTVNGQPHEVQVEPRLLLVHLLRDELGLTGTHVGCDTSNCGACTVHLDGEAVKSCTVLAVQADGTKVTTIQGLAQGDDLHRMREAFWEDHGLQCGYCTPGMIMPAVDLLARNPDPSEEEIRHGL